MNTNILTIQAGPAAFEYIQNNGLQPSDVTAYFGASGAAKWLTIYGLDAAIFGHWLKDASHIIDLFGTSIGAFKLAAGAQKDPTEALARLTDAYIDQHYTAPVTMDDISRETEKIINTVLAPGTAEEILGNPRFHFHCGAVRCHGSLARRNVRQQQWAMLQAFLRSAGSRQSLQPLMSRAIFSDPRSVRKASAADGYKTHSIPLNATNLVPALLASGSIPVYMHGVEDIAEAPAGTYRDGGLLDYHPLPGNIWATTDKIVLYPHFYDEVKVGWFDKFYSWRKATPEQLDNVLLISPSAEYVAGLPGGEIPNRRDFPRFKKDDSIRVKRWRTAADRSKMLGDAFLELATAGRIPEVVQELKR